ncbi:MAG: helix-turn-helix domain-containing protein [Bauldia sp.]|nr:helix-turn-helix domain-containing protein [Bauldia sp.]
MDAVVSSPRARRSDEKTRSAASGGAGVQSLTRALSILDALAASDDGMTLTALARQVALPPSSAHRLLTTMQRQRFVRFDQTSMSWQIGVQAFHVGNAFARTRDVAVLAKPYMRKLMEECGETVNLYVLSSNESVVCMAQIQCHQTIRAISRPGGQVRMHGSAAGKAMLAHMTREEVADIARKHGLARNTANTIDSLRKLHADLGRIRERGYSIDDEEFAIGLRCVASPIFDERGVAHAALSVAGPSSRIFDQRIAELGRMVGAAARSVTTELGGSISLSPG